VQILQRKYTSARQKYRTRTAIKRTDILFVQEESATHGPFNKFLGERLQVVSSARPPSTSTIAVQELLGVIHMHQRLHIVDLQYKDKGPGAAR